MRLEQLHWFLTDFDMLIIMGGPISLFLYNHDHENGSNPIFCSAREIAWTIPVILDQMLLALQTCSNPHCEFNPLTLNPKMRCPYLWKPSTNESPERPMMEIAANILMSLILAGHLTVERSVTELRTYNLVNTPREVPVSPMDPTCVQVSMSSNADITELALRIKDLVWSQQQYHPTCEPRHLVIRGVLPQTEDDPNLREHSLHHRTNDIPVVMQEFCSHLNSLNTILNGSPMAYLEPTHLVPTLLGCISYGKRACNILPTYLRAGTILTELPNMVTLTKLYLRIFSARPNAFQRDQAYDEWKLQINKLYSVVRRLLENCPTEERLSAIILSEALIIISPHGAADRHQH